MDADEAMRFRNGLVAVNVGLSPYQFESLRLSCIGLNISRHYLEVATSFTDLYKLIEQTVPQYAPSLACQMLCKVKYSPSKLKNLYSCVKEEVAIEGYPTLDLVLTVAVIIDDMTHNSYKKFKGYAHRTFLSNHHPSRITSRTVLMQLLIDANFMIPTNIGYLFAWLEASSCSEKLCFGLRDYCQRHEIIVPNWNELSVPLSTISSGVYNSIDNSESTQLIVTVVPTTKKEAFNCSVLILISTLILIAALIGNILLWKSLFSAVEQFNNTFTIGDYNSEFNTELLTIISSTSTVTLTLTSPDQRVSLSVYHTTKQPIKEIAHLPVVFKKTLDGYSLSNYNYYGYCSGAYKPIYLMAESNLTYRLEAMSSPSNANKNKNCSSWLFLVGSVSKYCENRNTLEYYAKSRCFPANNSKSIWTFTITKSASYYICLEILEGYQVKGNVSAVRAYYNTTGLARPNQCSNNLTATDRYCTITLCSSFICNSDRSYLLVQSKYESGPVQVNVIYTKTGIHVQQGIVKLVFGIVLLIINLLAICVYIFVCVYYRRFIIDCVKKFHFNY